MGLASNDHGTVHHDKQPRREGGRRPLHHPLLPPRRQAALPLGRGGGACCGGPHSAPTGSTTATTTVSIPIPSSATPCASTASSARSSCTTSAARWPLRGSSPIVDRVAAPSHTLPRSFQTTRRVRGLEWRERRPWAVPLKGQVRVRRRIDADGARSGPRCWRSGAPRTWWRAAPTRSRGSAWRCGPATSSTRRRRWPSGDRWRWSCPTISTPSTRTSSTRWRVTSRPRWCGSWKTSNKADARAPPRRGDRRSRRQEGRAPAGVARTTRARSSSGTTGRSGGGRCRTRRCCVLRPTPSASGSPAGRIWPR